MSGSTQSACASALPPHGDETVSTSSATPRTSTAASSRAPGAASGVAAFDQSSLPSPKTEKTCGETRVGDSSSAEPTELRLWRESERSMPSPPRTGDGAPRPGLTSLDLPRSALVGTIVRSRVCSSPTPTSSLRAAENARRANARARSKRTREVACAERP